MSQRTAVRQQPADGWLHALWALSQQLVDTFVLRPVATTERFWAGLAGAVSGGSQVRGPRRASVALPRRDGAGWQRPGAPRRSPRPAHSAAAAAARSPSCGACLPAR